MNSNIAKTIEQINISQTSGDLWGEFNDTINLNSMNLFIPQDNKITVRLLGPFVSISRFYAPFIKYDTKINIEGVADKDPIAIQEAKKILSDMEIKRKPFFEPSVLKYINTINSNMTWQKCVMVNAYVRGEERIKVMTLNRNMCHAIIQHIRGRENIILNGIFAPDISLTKRGEGLKIIFEAGISAPSYLNEKDMNIVFNNGLIDIPSFITDINKSKKSSYYYKMASNYRMPSEFTKALTTEMAKIEEEKHIRNTEEHLNEMPPEAFEKRNSMREAIGSLEL
jgi:hypothetical protein